ncbi:hypothetical protein [Rhodoligotrophos defluvii]|uniref:hypothetical protein n=1 Tax=Rhodoligotrophos defluvii TaxID=2561934 RepID=UPI0010C9A514|nr:hypothetical protein [Rhodoligotrophos defluvii]
MRNSFLVVGIAVGSVLAVSATEASAATPRIFALSNFGQFGGKPTSFGTDSVFSTDRVAGRSSRGVQTAALSSPSSPSASARLGAARVNPGEIRDIIGDLREAVRDRDREAVRNSIRALVALIRRAVSPN